MSESINLVSTKNDQLERELKRLRLFRIIAIASLVIVASISVIFFIIIITLPISAVKKDQQQTLTNISALHQKIVKYTLINDRARNITDTLSKRSSYATSSNAILNKLPEGLNVESITIETGTISLGVSGKSLIPINDFINQMVILGNEGKLIKNVILKSLILNATSGTYSLSFSADII